MIRQEIEQREKVFLAPYATAAMDAQGRARLEVPDEVRTCFMRDRDRIIHSKAFRRLKHKTQVYISPGNDHYRTRLTHTLEVAQIAKTIGRALRLNEDLIEAIALAHDVGHTPFAHTGEEVLAKLMGGGFRHNENSVRVLTRIEQHKDQAGLNLSAEVLDGVLYHSGFGTQGPCASTLEGQIIRYSDKIAYVQHDIDDSIRAGIIAEGDLPREHIEILGASHGGRISVLVNDLIAHSRAQLADWQVGDPLPNLTFSPEVDGALRGLRSYMFGQVYHGEVCSMERERAALIVEFLYQYYLDSAHEMPPFYQQIVVEESRERGVADYISGMTDNYCVALFQALTIPRSFIGQTFA